MNVLLTHNNLRAARHAAAPAAPELAPPPGPPASATAQVTADDMIERILKLIPGEAAAAYTVACGLVTNDTYVPIVAFALSIAVLILTIRRSAASLVPPVKPEPLQYVIRIAAFVAWAFAIHNPLQRWVTVPDWAPMLGVLFIPILGTLLFDRDATLEPPPA
jgi:hypothetical protein